MGTWIGWSTTRVGRFDLTQLGSKTILQSENMRSLEWNNTILVNFQTSSEGITYNRSQERPLSFLDRPNEDTEDTE